MRASSRSTGSGSASRSPGWRRVRAVAPGGDAADRGGDAEDGPPARGLASVGPGSSPDPPVPGWRAPGRSSVMGLSTPSSSSASSGSGSSSVGRSSSDRRATWSSAAPVAPAGASVALASRRSCPARSSPTRISPSSRSKRAGSPRARRVSTAVSVTVRAASAAENGRRSKRSGGANRPLAGTRSGSPAPPGRGSRPTFARVRGPGGRRPPGGSSSTMAAASSSGSDIRALSSRYPAEAPPITAATMASGPPSTSWIDPAVAGHRRFDRLEGVPDRSGLPAPRRSQRGPGQRVDRQQRRPPHAPGPRPSRGRRRRGDPGSDASVADRAPAGRAGSGRSGHRRSDRRAGAATRSRWRARGRRSRCPPPGSGGPRRASPGSVRRSRSRDAG